jgi:hypothetical protein
LQAISISDIYHAKYCDDALVKIKKAIHDNAPYDLLISHSKLIIEKIS